MIKSKKNIDLGAIYYPKSKGKSLNVDTPDSMAYEISAALQMIENKIGGDIDEYVKKKLAFKTLDELYSSLSAEQIDAVALAIYNMEERNSSLIIGDQTGIGKGRIAASIIRYGIKNGYKPIFITEKANLFTDIYRDLSDIGAGNYQPFIVNTLEKKTRVTDKNGNVVFSPPTKEVQQKIFASGKLPNNYDYVLMTYSQINAGDKAKSTSLLDKISFVNELAERNLIILDESHNAAGNSNSGKNLQKLVKVADGVTFLSATFAKRPDNLPIYALKTVMNESSLNDEQLTEAITKGGVALQEIISSQLVKEGQMIRRERTYEGIEVNYIYEDSKFAEQRNAANKITDLMRNIIELQRLYILPLIDRTNKILKDEAKKANISTSDLGLKANPYFSKVFNITNQLLFSIKADSVADRAIMRLKEGKKPVIAFSSTMGSFVQDLLSGKDDDIEDFDEDEFEPETIIQDIKEQKFKTDFSTVLQKGLDSVFNYFEKNGKGQVIKKTIELDSLSSEGQLFYKYIKNKINTVSTGITISPIDYIKSKIEAAGYKVGEATGRQYEIEFAKSTLGKVSNEYSGGYGYIKSRKKIPVNELFRKFNDNELDVLMINQTGSTGASAHAIVTDKVSKDKVKQRVMIVLQAELNINTEVQKRGRINRTGQILKPIYDYVFSAIPAEKRLAMMLQKKLKSLDANTSSNQKNSEKIQYSDDFLNKYGDEVVSEYLIENPEFASKIDMSIKSSGEDGEFQDIAHKVSGRVAILDTKEQEEFYNDILEKYESYISYLKETGEYNLEVEAIDFKAKSIDKNILVVNSSNKGSAFSDNTYIEKIEVDSIKKPFKLDELKKKINEFLDGVSPEAYSSNLIKQAEITISSRAKELIDEKVEFYRSKYDAIKNDSKYNKLIETDKEDEALEYLKKQVEEISEKEKEDINKIRTKYQNERSFLDNIFDFFKPGRNILYRSDSSTSEVFGVVLGFKFGKNKKNQFAPGNISVSIAIASSSRLLTLPLSGKLLNVLLAIKGLSPYRPSSLEDVFQKWEYKIKDFDKNRVIRYVATGNLLQFYGQIGIPKAKLIQFTTINNTIRKGALMPEDYSFGLANRQTISVPLSKCYKYISSLNSKKPLICSSELTIINSYGEIKFILPKNEKFGGYIFLNKELLNNLSSNNFFSVGNKMVGTCQLNSLQSVLNILTTLKVSATIPYSDYETYFDGMFNIKSLTDDEVKIVKVNPPDNREQTRIIDDSDTKAKKLKLAKAKLRLARIRLELQLVLN